MEFIRQSDRQFWQFPHSIPFLQIASGFFHLTPKWGQIYPQSISSVFVSFVLFLPCASTDGDAWRCGISQTGCLCGGGGQLSSVKGRVYIFTILVLNGMLTDRLSVLSITYPKFDRYQKQTQKRKKKQPKKTTNSIRYHRIAKPLLPPPQRVSDDSRPKPRLKKSRKPALPVRGFATVVVFSPAFRSLGFSWLIRSQVCFCMTVRFLPKFYQGNRLHSRSLNPTFLFDIPLSKKNLTHAWQSSAPNVKSPRRLF